MIPAWPSRRAWHSWPRSRRGRNEHGGRGLPRPGRGEAAHEDDPYYQDIDAAPVHPDSASLIEYWMQDEADPPNPWWRVLTALLHPTHYGYPYCVVPESQPMVPLAFDPEWGYPQFSEDEAPIPADMPIEGIAAGDPIPTGFLSDQHAFIVVRDEITGGPKETWELYSAHKPDGTTWTLSRLAWKYAADSMYYDRADGIPTTAAGGTRIMLPLIKYDDVYTRGVIDHALRIMLYSGRGEHIPPARKQASGSYTRPPFGMRMRLKASFDISGFSAGCRVVLQALKTYGCIFDDGGPQLELTGTRDARWDAYHFRPELNTIDVSNMEVLDWGRGYALTPPASLDGVAGVPSGEFAIELTPPLQNVGEGHPSAAPAGFVFHAFRNAVWDSQHGSGWSGDPAGGSWTVNGSNNYRLDLTTAAPSATFTYTPAGDAPDGPITLWWVDNTIQRAVPDAIVYTIGEPGALVAGSISITTPATSTTVGLTVTEATGGTGPCTRQWHRSTSSGFTPGVGTALSGATALTLSETGLTPSTSYYYKVVQTDSATASVTTAQKAVTTTSGGGGGGATTCLMLSVPGGVLNLGGGPQ